jgi:hypothetical protein
MKICQKVKKKGESSLGKFLVSKVKEKFKNH